MSENQKLLNKFSFGVGDRFAHQAKAHLQALIKAKDSGVNITPVWNKSYREHQIINSKPQQTRVEADAAVNELNWNESYLLDADHINLSNVDYFIDSCDFYTIDVADFIGKQAEPGLKQKFIESNKKYIGELQLPVLGTKIKITDTLIENVANKYLFAVSEAGIIYRHIKEKKQDKPFVIEVSMDETELPQTPDEMFLILAAIKAENIPVQTIAPKFSGRFNKGVDYVGDVSKFRTEFEQDVAVVQLAIKEFGLSKDLKLSVHSGSDKFSIYPAIKETIKKFDTGLHLKTAGTTWLEELIGLAESGGVGLQIAKEIYRESLDHYDELCAPYATVIDIDKSKLPALEEVEKWDGETYASTLRHDQSNSNYNLHFRQLLHVGYKIAANMGERYLKALEDNEEIIGKNVTENIFDRHIKQLFL